MAAWQQQDDRVLIKCVQANIQQCFKKFNITDCAQVESCKIKLMSLVVECVGRGWQRTAIESAVGFKTLP